jgi:predicted dehydrogenase
MKLRVGVIGLGRMGRLHLMNSLRIDDVYVVAVADKSKSALKRAKSLGVQKLFLDYQKLLNDCHDLDAVLISLPNFLHFPSIQLALESGVNVFIEKPLATTSKECLEIMKKVKASGRKLMVGHCMRFLTVVERMKTVLSKGSIGKLEVITIEEILNGPFAHGVIPKPIPEWWFNPQKTGGGALIDLGYHWIDIFRYFTESRKARVLFSHLDYRLNLPIEDGAIVILKSLENLVTGIIHVGWYQKSIFPRYNFRLVLHGDAGYMSSEELIPKNMYLHAIKEGMKNLLRKTIRKKIHPLSYTYYYEAYYNELEHFFSCIKNDLEPSVSAIDGLRTIEIIEEVYKRSTRTSNGTK